MSALLPPGARPCPVNDASESFGILSEGDGTYRFERGNSPVSRRVDLAFAVSFFERELQKFVGLNASEMIFVHAGVVVHDGRALVLPGLSFSGKTTLVSALVEAGTRYYSQEFAVIDRAGLVYRFATPLPAARSQFDATGVESSRPGGSGNAQPVPIGAVIFTEYAAGAEWRPRPLSLGQGVLAMLHHALVLPDRAGEAMRLLSRAMQDAVLLDGTRGEASEFVSALLATPLDELASAVAGNEVR